MQSLIKKNGFTLLELIIVIVIVGLLSATASRVIAVIFSTLQTGQSSIDASWQARVAFERMIRDIRAIPSISSISNTSTANQLVYTNAAGTTITYSLSGTQLMMNTQVLADGTQSLTFGYYDQNGNAITPPPTANTNYITITLNITAGNNNFTLSTAVYPWNI